MSDRFFLCSMSSSILRLIATKNAMNLLSATKSIKCWPLPPGAALAASWPTLLNFFEVRVFVQIHSQNGSNMRKFSSLLEKQSLCGRGEGAWPLALVLCVSAACSWCW